MNISLPGRQRLQYRPLSQFMGRQLTIPAFAEVEKVLLQEMGMALPVQFSLDSELSWIAQVMAKYRILDLTFKS